MCSTPKKSTPDKPVCRGVLAVGAHWDDIEIGCGLTLMRLARETSSPVYGLILTESDYKVPTHGRTASLAGREGRKAFVAMGITEICFSKQPTQWLKYDTNVMKALEAIAVERKIGMVFVPWSGDHNTDHRAAWELCRVAFRHVPTLLQYQSNGYHDAADAFAPQLFWGFEYEEYAAKRKLLEIHASEWIHRKGQWASEVFAKEMYWGGLCGCDYAEAFMVSRMLMG